MTSGVSSAVHRPPVKTGALDVATMHAVLGALPQAVFVFQNAELVSPQWRNGAADEWPLDMASVFAASSVLGRAINKVAAGGGQITFHDYALGVQVSPAVMVSSYGDGVVVTAMPPVAVAEQGQEARTALRPAAMLARVLAHEIKNPLAGISAAAQLLQRGGADDASAELSGLIVRESSRIARLVDRVMIFDEETPAELLPLNIHAPLEQAVASVSLANDLEVERLFDPSLPDILGDHDKLVQVFINLCRNAAEAGAKRVVLRTFYVLSRPPIDKVTQTKLPIAVSVEDDGAGMDAETKARLFEAYYTTKSQGQGLGLPVVAKIIGDHEGQVMVESSSSKTIFTLYFPHPRTFKETP